MKRIFGLDMIVGKKTFYFLFYYIAISYLKYIYYLSFYYLQNIKHISFTRFFILIFYLVNLVVKGYRIIQNIIIAGLAAKSRKSHTSTTASTSTEITQEKKDTLVT